MDLHIRDLDVDLDGKSILKDLNLDIESGQLIGIIGPNGSGKSTLLRTVYRVIKKYRGEILLNNEDLRSLSLRASAKKMAVVAQHNQQEFDFKVFDMVLAGRSPHKKFMEQDTKEDLDKVKWSLDQVGMLAYKDRSYNSLSGGEKQRIVLARALAQDTSCLILDEPTNHLDIKYQFQFMDIAKNLGITVIAAIHDLNIASLYCDKIYVLKEGRLVASGEPRQVFTQELIGQVFGVKAKIIEEDKHINIIYKPF